VGEKRCSRQEIATSDYGALGLTRALLWVWWSASSEFLVLGRVPGGLRRLGGAFRLGRSPEADPARRMWTEIRPTSDSLVELLLGSRTTRSSVY